MPSIRTRPAVATAVALLALVAGVAATSPTADAARGAPTKLRSTSWPASPMTYGASAYVNGKIKSTKRAHRVVLLQMRLPSGWKQVAKDRTTTTGQFHLKVKTNWYHKKLPFRVFVKPTRKAQGKTGRAHELVVNPEYAAAGSASQWTRIAAGYRVQFNPCGRVRWRLNTQYAPDGVEPEVMTAVAQLAKATGIRFVYAGGTTAIPGSNRAWPRNTNLVVAWASPGQTSWSLAGDIIGRGGQLSTRYARNGKGQRVFQITRSGLVLDNTFDATPGFAGPNARGSIIVHELGHVAGLGHADEHLQQMFWQAENWGNGVYQAGDLAGLRRVGLMTGCLHKVRRFGRAVPGFVPEPEPVTAYPIRRSVG